MSAIRADCGGVQVAETEWHEDSARLECGEKRNNESCTIRSIRIWIMYCRCSNRLLQLEEDTQFSRRGRGRRREERIG